MGNGNAAQQGGIPTGAALVGSVGLGQCLLPGDGNKAVVLGIEFRNAIEVVAGDFRLGKVTLAKPLDDTGNCQRMHDVRQFPGISR